MTYEGITPDELEDLMYGRDYLMVEFIRIDDVTVREVYKRKQDNTYWALLASYDNRGCVITYKVYEVEKDIGLTEIYVTKDKL